MWCLFCSFDHFIVHLTIFSGFTDRRNLSGFFSMNVHLAYNEATSTASCPFWSLGSILLILHHHTLLPLFPLSIHQHAFIYFLCVMTRWMWDFSSRPAVVLGFIYGFMENSSLICFSSVSHPPPVNCGLFCLRNEVIEFPREFLKNLLEAERRQKIWVWQHKFMECMEAMLLLWRKNRGTKPWIIFPVNWGTVLSPLTSGSFSGTEPGFMLVINVFPTWFKVLLCSGCSFRYMNMCIHSKLFLIVITEWRHIVSFNDCFSAGLCVIRFNAATRLNVI